MDSRYVREVREFVPYDGLREGLVTMAEAAEILSVTVQAISVAIGQDRFESVIHDTQKTWAGRRLLVRAEVLARRETVRRS